jgi:hypothetical protein
MSGCISVALQSQIRAHFHNCCAYCQTAEALTAMTFEFEHIAPKSQGGATVFENLCFACPFCNRHKSDRQQLRDPESGQKLLLDGVVKQHESYDSHLSGCWSPDYCRSWRWRRI